MCATRDAAVTSQNPTPAAWTRAADPVSSSPHLGITLWRSPLPTAATPSLSTAHGPCGAPVDGTCTTSTRMGMTSPAVWKTCGQRTFRPQDHQLGAHRPPPTVHTGIPALNCDDAASPQRPQAL